MLKNNRNKIFASPLAVKWHGKSFILKRWLAIFYEAKGKEKEVRVDYNDYCSSQSEKIILNEVRKTN